MKHWGWDVPRFYYAPLATNASGERLAKRDAALALKSLRGQVELSAGKVVESLLPMLPESIRAAENFS